MPPWDWLYDWCSLSKACVTATLSEKIMYALCEICRKCEPPLLWSPKVTYIPLWKFRLHMEESFYYCPSDLRTSFLKTWHPIINILVSKQWASVLPCYNVHSTMACSPPGLVREPDIKLVHTVHCRTEPESGLWYRYATFGIPGSHRQQRTSAQIQARFLRTFPVTSKEIDSSCVITHINLIVAFECPQLPVKLC